MSTLYDDLLDLLDRVGTRDCILGLRTLACDLEDCEPCRARELYARMVEARDRVA